MLLVGGRGLVGRALARALATEYQVVTTDVDSLDVRDGNACDRTIASVRPDIVVNTAAFLNADVCEREPEKSYGVNVGGVRNLLRAVRRRAPEAVLLHFSTDFVFDGVKGGYSEDNLPQPISVYGMHKWLADEMIMASGVNAWVLRLASVIGLKEPAKTFARAIVSGAAVSDELRVVDDLIISTVTTDLVASVVGRFLSSCPAFGLYNCVAEGATTWAQVARALIDGMGLPCEVVPISSREYRYEARRPSNSSLRIDKLRQLYPVPTWSEAIADHVERHRKEYESVVLAARGNRVR